MYLQIYCTCNEMFKNDSYYLLINIDEADGYRNLLEFFQQPHDTEEVFKALFSSKGYVPPLIDGPDENKKVLFS